MKFYSKPIAEHPEVPLPDDGELEEIIDYWDDRERSPVSTPTSGGRRKSYVVSVGSIRDAAIRDAQLAEILNLVGSLGDEVVGSEIVYQASINSKTHLGPGKAEELATRAKENGASLLVLDAELSPSQMRNLEDVAGIPICDRELVILSVFLRHARTRRARIQVELAHLDYLRPRIRGVGINMDQQMGGAAGSRGPGETASELLARKLDGRIAELKRGLKTVETAGRTQTKGRSNCKRIVLIGYTNAGKTSLMNALTNAQLFARNMPFETLDTTSRALTRHGGDVLLSDTVGFIRRLPERLFESFASTFDEISDSSLLVIVVDTSDCEWKEHIKTTVSMLDRLKATETPRFYVFNKVDRLTEPLDPAALADLSSGHPYLALSSTDETSVDQLREALVAAVNSEHEIETFNVPYAAAPVLQLIYGRCRILKSKAHDTGLTLEVQGHPL